MTIEEFAALFKKQFYDEAVEIGESEEFREHEMWDSLTAMAVLTMVENKFGVVISNDEFKDMRTIKDVFECVCKKSNK